MTASSNKSTNGITHFTFLNVPRPLTENTDSIDGISKDAKRRRRGNDMSDVDKKRMKQAYRNKVCEWRSVGSLMEAQPGDFPLDSRITFSHTEDRNHKGAETRSIGSFKLLSPNAQELEKENCFDYWAFSLALITHFWECGRVEPVKMSKPYQSEADICNFTRMAVVDAIKILELEKVFAKGELCIHYERSLFGCSPDMMIVRGRDNVGLIAIQVKQPAEKPLRSYPRGVGHAFDHAMAMKAFNVATDIVLVTSFEESFLGSVKREDLTRSVKNGNGAMEPDHGSSLQKTTRRFHFGRRL